MHGSLSNAFALRSLMAMFAVFSNAGCVSGLIAGSGKSYRHLEDPKVTVAQVRKELGEPTFSCSYNPLKRISETEVYRARAAEYPEFPPVVIARKTGSGFSYAKDHYTGFCEVYNPHG